MEHSKYIIIFSGHERGFDWNYEDEVHMSLKRRQSELGIISFDWMKNSLVELCFTHILQRNDMAELIGNRIRFGVLSLKLSRNPFQIDLEIDSVLRESVDVFHEPILAASHYLVQEGNGYRFHQVTRFRENQESIDDDHLNLGGVVLDHPDMFYQHFYGSDDYSDTDSVFLSKILLSTSATGLEV